MNPRASGSIRPLNSVVSDSIERSAYWSELCENNLREILLLLARRESKQIDARIEETQHLLSANMTAAFRIEDLAKKVGLSPSRLSHLYKETIGISIVESLNQMRIRQAALLLEHTNRTATEVALDVGFRTTIILPINFASITVTRLEPSKPSTSKRPAFYK